MALPRSLQHRPGAAHHRLAAPPRLRLALRAGSRAQGDSGRVPRVRRHPLATSCKTCWRGSTRPIRRSSVASSGARRRASRASRGAIATTPSPSRSTATAHGWIMAFWSSPRSGASASIGLARSRARPRPSRSRKEADGWYVAISCADVPVQPLPPTGQETGIDLGLESFATLADGQRISTPSYYRKAEAYLRRCQRRVARRKKGSHRRRKAVALLAKAHQHIASQRRDFHHKKRARWSKRTTRSITKTCGSPTWSRTTISPRASPMRGGARS